MTWWATPLLLSCYFWLSSYIKGFGVELCNLCLKQHCWKKKDEKKKLHMETTAFCQRLAMLSGCSWPSSLLNSDTSITLAPLSALQLQILSHSHKHYSFFPSFTQGLYSIRKKEPYNSQAIQQQLLPIENLLQMSTQEEERSRNPHYSSKNLLYMY